jgi:hypothetical protein
MRSDILKKNVETIPHRALLMSAGVKKKTSNPASPLSAWPTATTPWYRGISI